LAVLAVVHGFVGDDPVATLLTVLPPEQGKLFTAHTVIVMAVEPDAPVPVKETFACDPALLTFVIINAVVTDTV
jgi:hypothetical protein